MIKRFIVEHEQDEIKDSDTIVGDTASDPDNGTFAVVTFHNSLPRNIRKQLADLVCNELEKMSDNIQPNG